MSRNCHPIWLMFKEIALFLVNTTENPRHKVSWVKNSLQFLLQCQVIKIKIILIYEPSSLDFENKNFYWVKKYNKNIKVFYCIAMLQPVTRDTYCLGILIVFSQKSAFCL